MLIIDDEPALLRVLARLVGRNWRALPVADAAAARVAVSRHREAIAVVLCDVLVGDITGPELRDQLIAVEPAVGTRFVFMTGGGLPAAVLARLAQTGCTVLDKPIEPAVLDEVLARELADPKPLPR